MGHSTAQKVKRPKVNRLNTIYTMTSAELEDYLHEHLPLSKAMQVSAIEVNDDSVLLSAPLEPNINHCGTVFGGSASTLAILSAWSLLHVRLQTAGIESQLVVQRNTMEYKHPIDGEFTARSVLTDSTKWDRFIRMFSRKGKARISVDSELIYQGKIAGRFRGEFVVLAKKINDEFKSEDKKV